MRAIISALSALANLPKALTKFLTSKGKKSGKASRVTKEMVISYIQSANIDTLKLIQGEITRQKKLLTVKK